MAEFDKGDQVAETAAQAPEAHAEEEQQPETIAQVQERLGPFQVPEGFLFESEFAHPVPRPIPRHIKEGRYQRTRAINLNVAIAIGLFCVLFAQHHFVVNLSYYFLPLGYLEWIGWIVFALSVPFIIHFLFFPGKLAYVKSGEPIVMRILGFNVYYGGTQEVPLFGFQILADCINPKSGALEARWFNTELLDSVGSAPRYKLAVSQGDYITGVYVPGEFLTTVTPYDLLNLRSENKLVLKDGVRLATSRKIRDAIVGVALLGGILSLILVFCYYGLHFFPFDEETHWELIGTSAGICALLFGLPSFIVSRRRKNSGNVSDSSPIGVAFLGIVGGALLGVFLPLTLNAALDYSEPKLREVRIVGFWQKTYNHMVRTYDIDYVEFDLSTRRKHSSNLDQIGDFYGTMSGVLEVKDGLFGMKWPRRLLPVVFVELDLGDDKTHARKLEMTDKRTGDVQVMLVDLRVEVDGGYLDDISPELREHAWKTVEKDGFDGGAIKVRVFPPDVAPPPSGSPNESST